MRNANFDFAVRFALGEIPGEPAEHLTILERVARHFRKQQAYAYSAYTGACSYLGEDGNKCAAGVFVEHYTKDMEGRSADAESVSKNLEPLAQRNLALILGLQKFHDNCAEDKYLYHRFVQHLFELRDAARIQVNKMEAQLN